MAEVETKLFPIEALRDFSSRVFLHFGVPKVDAAQAADVLASADLRGIDSHGVARLHSYFDMLTLRRINPLPEIKVLRSTPSTATIDGDNGLGLVVGPHANRFAMDMAERFGSGWVMTNSTKLVAPLWGAERMLGTNPIAIGFPGKEEPPIVIDMATSAAAYGKIEIARRRGEPIPEGWAVDSEGRDTTNPNDMVEGGALLPLGSDRERGGHKGYGLAIMVDVLCGALSGANWGPFTPPFALRQEIPSRSVGNGIGHFFGAMQIDGFIDRDSFKRQIDDYIRVFRATKPTPGTNGPLIPGDPERDAEKWRRENGVPLVLPVVEELRDISQKARIPFE